MLRQDELEQRFPRLTVQVIGLAEVEARPRLDRVAVGGLQKFLQLVNRFLGARIGARGFDDRLQQKVFPFQVGRLVDRQELEGHLLLRTPDAVDQ